jgi:hypothetical protein
MEEEAEEASTQGEVGPPPEGSVVAVLAAAVVRESRELLTLVVGEGVTAHILGVQEQKVEHHIQ